jgi:hypothetical protein
MTRSTFEIRGTIHGGLWWPMEAPAWKELSATFSRDGGPFVDKADTLREAVEGILTREGGDFSTAPLLNGTLTVVRRTARREHRRTFELSALPSIADYVTDELPVWPEDAE